MCTTIADTDQADLLEPLQLTTYERWVVPLTVRPNDAADETAEDD
jgi:hypothetical protein